MSHDEKNDKRIRIVKWVSQLAEAEKQLISMLQGNVEEDRLSDNQKKILWAIIDLTQGDSSIPVQSAAIKSHSFCFLMKPPTFNRALSELSQKHYLERGVDGVGLMKSGYYSLGRKLENVLSEDKDYDLGNLCFGRL